MVTELLARWEAWNVTAVPVQYPGPDDRCESSLHGHVFAAWGRRRLSKMVDVESEVHKMKT